MIAQKVVYVKTEKGKMSDITDEVSAFIKKSGADFGIANIFVQHTTCSVFIQENETMLKEDIRYMLDHVSEKPIYYHPGNARNHMKASVLGQSVNVPIIMGKPGLGAWQRILLYEFDRTTRRAVVVTIIGEKLSEQERKQIMEKMSENIEIG